MSSSIKIMLQEFTIISGVNTEEEFYIISKQQKFAVLYHIFDAINKDWKRTGDRCPPWGPPEVILVGLEQKPFILTTCLITDK